MLMSHSMHAACVEKDAPLNTVNNLVPIGGPASPAFLFVLYPKKKLLVLDGRTLKNSSLRIHKVLKINSSAPPPNAAQDLGTAPDMVSKQALSQGLSDTTLNMRRSPSASLLSKTENSVKY